MSDNSELVGRLANRPGDPVPPPVSGYEWNSPIDTTQADSMTETEVLRGMVTRCKETVRRWDIAPIPDDWV